jgi:hypothetical protein
VGSRSLAALAIFGALALASTAFAQTAQLTGTVNDRSGAVVPNARVTATNVATGVARSATTNGSGNYLITALLPGNYQITTEAAGFRQIAQGPLTFAVDQVAGSISCLMLARLRKPSRYQQRRYCLTLPPAR